VGDNVTNVFGLNLHQLRKVIGSVSDHFHLALAIPSKIISAQEFTQTFALMTFRAQRAKIWLVGFR